MHQPSVVSDKHITILDKEPVVGQEVTVISDFTGAMRPYPLTATFVCESGEIKCVVGEIRLPDLQRHVALTYRTDTEGNIVDPVLYLRQGLCAS
ncbi:MAG: hypothetical protein WDZ81_01015 [Candidatus Saccharimonadales bacterium]